MSRRQRVLIYRTGHLGDTVCAIPAFRLIRQNYPDAELTLLCDLGAPSKVAARDVVATLGIFDTILCYRSLAAGHVLTDLVARILQASPDQAILLPQSRESSNSVARKRALFRSLGVGSVLGEYMPPPTGGWRLPEPYRLLEMLRRCGLAGAKPAYDISTSSTYSGQTQELLRRAGIEPDLPFLVFCGGGKAASQRWPMKRYASVLSAIRPRLLQPVVAIGSAAECAEYRRLMHPNDVLVLDPVSSCAVLFEILRLAWAYFGNDTGVMHVAAAMSCPVAAVISARNFPGSWDPDVEPSRIFRHRLPCEGCFVQECVTQQHRCMAEIGVEEVIEGLQSFFVAVDEVWSVRRTMG